MRVVPLVLATGLIAAGCATTTEPAADTAAEPATSAAPAPSPSPEPSPSPSEEPPESAEPDETTSPEPTKKAKPATKEPAKKKPAPKPGTPLITAASQYGPVLFNGQRQAIYIFDKEKTARSECYGACAEAWPPVLTRGEPVARGHVRDRLLGTTKRRDGTMQVTYAGQPLYYYAHEGPGQVLCHDVPGFGGLWLALKADGTPPA